MSTKQRRRRKVGAASGLWLLAGAVLGLFATLVEATSLLVYLLVGCACCAGMAYVATKTGQGMGVQTRRASVERKPAAGGKPAARKTAAKPSTKPRKRPNCSPRCKRSTKPASTCNCVCEGKTHGKGMTREGLKSVDMQLQEKAAVRRQRKAAS